MALVVLDATVVIAFLDQRDTHHNAAVAALERVAGDELVLPASAYAEMLVFPYRRGGRAAVATAKALLEELPIRVEPIGVEIAERAAELRASTPAVRLPDALVIATADALDASTLLTADRRWRRASRRVRTI